MDALGTIMKYSGYTCMLEDPYNEFVVTSMVNANV